MGRLSLSLVVVTLTAGGCQFPQYLVHNLHFEASRCVDESKEDHSIEQMAADAWARMGNDPSGRWNHSDDFREGFLSGFTYFVKRGGDGEPPPVPPSSYWKESYRSPEGHACVENWFAGYRLGTQVAKEGRYRERQVVTLSRPLYDDTRLSQQPSTASPNLPYPRTLPQQQGAPIPLPSDPTSAKPGTR